MRLTIKINLLLILFFQFLYAQNGKISINSSPIESWVRIDSILVGKTPLIDIQVEAGSHLIDIAPPEGGIWNYEDKHLEISRRQNDNN